MIRAFLACGLSEDLRAHISQVQHDLKQRLSREVSKGVRIAWAQPSSVHLTFTFLGDIDEQQIDSLRAAVSTLTTASPALQIPIERLGAFPHPQQPRVLWVGPSQQWEQSENAKRLSALHQSVEDCCRPFGFAPEDRLWSPHLTLARVKEGAGQVGQVLAQCGVMDQPLSFGALAVKAVALMRSELRPTGSLYTKLWEVLVSDQ